MFSRLTSFVPTISHEHVRPFGVHFKAQNPDHNRLLIPQLFEGKYISFVHSDRDYENMDVVVDLFQEEARLSARRRHSIDSPLDQWYSGRVTKLVLSEALRRYSRLDSFALREAFYLVFLFLIEKLSNSQHTLCRK